MTFKALNTLDIYVIYTFFSITLQMGIEAETFYFNKLIDNGTETNL